MLLTSGANPHGHVIARMWDISVIRISIVTATGGTKFVDVVKPSKGSVRRSTLAVHMEGDLNYL